MFKPKYKILMDTIGFSKVINIFLLTHDHGKIERGTIRLCKKIDVCTLACLVIGWPLTQDSLTWSGEGFLSGRESHDGSIYLMCNVCTCIVMVMYGLGMGMSKV